MRMNHEGTMIFGENAASETWYCGYYDCWGFHEVVVCLVERK